MAPECRFGVYLFRKVQPATCMALRCRFTAPYLQLSVDKQFMPNRALP
jgi:hypothetical protein